MTALERSLYDRNDIIALERSLYNWNCNYIEFKDYFTYYLSKYCNKYNLDSMDGCCECIVSDILTIIKDEVDIWRKMDKDISLEDISNEIDYVSIIDEVLCEYHTYETPIVGYVKSMDYLIGNDITLTKTLKLVHEHGYNIEKLDTEKLANILYRHKQDEDVEKFKKDTIDIIKVFCKYYITNLYNNKNQ